MVTLNKNRAGALVVALLAGSLASCGMDIDESGNETDQSLQGLDSRAALQNCGTNCELVMAGIGWVVTEAGVEPKNVVFDAEYRWTGGASEAISPVMQQMVSRSGIMIAPRESILDCDDDRMLATPPKPRCRLREGRIFVTIGPVDMKGDTASAQVGYVEEFESMSGVVSRSYLLKLVRSENQWIVTDARLFSMS